VSDRVGKVRAGGVDLVGCGPAAEGDADRALGLGGGLAHGGQYRRGLVAAGVTGRARGHDNVAQVSDDVQGCGAVDADVCGVLQTVDEVPVYVYTVGQESGKRVLEAVAQGLQPLRFTGCQRAGGKCCCFTESGSEGDVFGAGAPALLLAAAADERVDRRPRADVERANPLGRVDLVADDGEQVDGQCVDVDVDLAQGLRRPRAAARPWLGSPRRSQRWVGSCRFRCLRASPTPGRCRR
jgi:hypothetical protein